MHETGHRLFSYEFLTAGIVCRICLRVCLKSTSTVLRFICLLVRFVKVEDVIVCLGDVPYAVLHIFQFPLKVCRVCVFHISRSST